jgi:hypothetical protein
MSQISPSLLLPARKPEQRVPTYVVGNELFWGQDAFEMLVGYLRDPQSFDDEEMRRVGSLPVRVTRNRVTRT